LAKGDLVVAGAGGRRLALSLRWHTKPALMVSYW